MDETCAPASASLRRLVESHHGMSAYAVPTGGGLLHPTLFYTIIAAV